MFRSVVEQCAKVETDASLTRVADDLGYRHRIMPDDAFNVSQLRVAQTYGSAPSPLVQAESTATLMND